MKIRVRYEKVGGGRGVDETNIFDWQKAACVWKISRPIRPADREECGLNCSRLYVACPYKMQSIERDQREGLVWWTAWKGE